MCTMWELIFDKISAKKYRKQVECRWLKAWSLWRVCLNNSNVVPITLLLNQEDLFRLRRCRPILSIRQRYLSCRRKMRDHNNASRYLPRVSFEKSSIKAIADDVATTMVRLVSHISRYCKYFAGYNACASRTRDPTPHCRLNKHHQIRRTEIHRGWSCSGIVARRFIASSEETRLGSIHPCSLAAELTQTRSYNGRSTSGQTDRDRVTRRGESVCRMIKARYTGGYI